MCVQLASSSLRSTERRDVQIDNRIRHGLSRGLELGILKKGDTIVAIQGWRSGGGSTNTVRRFSSLVRELR